MSSEAPNEGISEGLSESTTEKKKLSEQIDELTAIVRKLEDPSIELEDALAVYEAGMKIAKAAQAALEDAEQRIETVSATHASS
ncbi:Exodeoxyribonuclease VII small subunit [gamma proteobacterium HIMB55]|jgi:exodeoxyribonuclease VII small subunit|nr:Exodeoxyribonuclease VII small subunit [gamma proteobacterium HIMB55]